MFNCIQHALSTAKKIYACETIQVALAHRAVSKALLVLQQFDTEKYYLHACEALRIAKNSLSDEHPMLYLFLHTSGKKVKWEQHCKNARTISLLYRTVNE